MLRAFLFVGIGGFAGSMARYGLTVLINKYTNHPFPLATFVINMLGCLIIGLLFGAAQRNEWLHSTTWLIAATGFCGGFTTFSAFALENVYLMKNQLNITTIIYTAMSVVLGLLLCKAGIVITGK